MWLWSGSGLQLVKVSFGTSNMFRARVGLRVRGLQHTTGGTPQVRSGHAWPYKMHGWRCNLNEAHRRKSTHIGYRSRTEANYKVNAKPKDKVKDKVNVSLSLTLSIRREVRVKVRIGPGLVLRLELGMGIVLRLGPGSVLGLGFVLRLEFGLGLRLGSRLS